MFCFFCCHCCCCVCLLVSCLPSSFFFYVLCSLFLNDLVQVYISCFCLFVRFCFRVFVSPLLFRSLLFVSVYFVFMLRCSVFCFCSWCLFLFVAPFIYVFCFASAYLATVELSLRLEGRNVRAAQPAGLGSTLANTFFLYKASCPIYSCSPCPRPCPFLCPPFPCRLC